MAAKKIKAVALPVPATREEAERLLGAIGTAQRSLRILEAKLSERVAQMREPYDAEAQQLNDAIDEQFAAVHAWAEAHRDDLLDGKGKTVRMATGELSWRMSPPSVRITKPEAVVDALEQHGLGGFVRTRKEIDKQAVLADPEAVRGIKGLSVMQREEFVAKPFETELEKVEPAKVTVREQRGAGR